MLAFNSDDPSLNIDEAYNSFCKSVLKEPKYTKRGRGLPIFEKLSLCSKFKTCNTYFLNEPT